jgi:hypothetical protein
MRLSPLKLGTEFLEAHPHVHLDIRRRTRRGSTGSSCSCPSSNAGSCAGGEFDLVEQLAARIIAFIKDYNRTATPFRWTYDGRPTKMA